MERGARYKIASQAHDEGHASTPRQTLTYKNGQRSTKVNDGNSIRLFGFLLYSLAANRLSHSPFIRPDHGSGFTLGRGKTKWNVKYFCWCLLRDVNGCDSPRAIVKYIVN